MAGKLERGCDSTTKKERRGRERYRRITIMPAFYKIYVAVLAERIREEIDEKDFLPQNQIAFRKRMGAIYNTYVMNYLARRQIGKERRSLTALFVDLKAAFDSVDRKILTEALRKRGIGKD